MALLTVLHDISNDAKFVKVAASAFCAEWLLENDLSHISFATIPALYATPYLHVVDMISVPGRTEEFVSESQDEDVLHHLLAEIVIDTEELLFLPIGLERSLELSSAGQIFTEGFLNLQCTLSVCCCGRGSR